MIIARRDKVGLTWLTHVNPLVDFALAADGTLTFGNVAVDTPACGCRGVVHGAMGAVRQQYR